MTVGIAMLMAAFAQEQSSTPLPEGVYRPGDGVSAPQVVYKVDPEYSEEARLARLQGAAVLRLIVDKHGLPRDVRPVRSLGLGLDEKAIDAVSKWQFRPGIKEGEPVPVQATIEVNFRLLDAGTGWSVKSASFQTPEGVTRPVLESAFFPAGAPQSAPTKVSMSFDVDPDGVPFNLSVKSSSDASVEKALMDSVRQWRFHPAMRGDTTVAVPVRFVFERDTH